MFKYCEFFVLLLVFHSVMEYSYCNGLSIKSSDFYRWACINICTAPVHHNEVKDYCVRLASRYSPNDVYSEHEITLNSGCMGSNILLEDDDGDKTTEQRRIGRCYLSKTMIKCISTSWDSDDLIVYSYYDEICHPEEVLNGFFTSGGGGGGGGGGSSGSYQSSSCFSGCTIT